tara:strand:- start:843 stop:1208 length:366 start_codon:yes stop_codon:yes gene_type:complete
MAYNRGKKQNKTNKTITVSQAKQIFKDSLFDDSTINKYLGILDDNAWSQFIIGGQHYTSEWIKFKSIGYTVQDFIQGMWHEYKQHSQPDFFLRLMALFMCEEVKTAFITNDFLSNMTIIKH